VIEGCCARRARRFPSGRRRTLGRPFHGRDICSRGCGLERRQARYAHDFVFAGARVGPKTASQTPSFCIREEWEAINRGLPPEKLGVTGQRPSLEVESRPMRTSQDRRVDDLFTDREDFYEAATGAMRGAGIALQRTVPDHAVGARREPALEKIRPTGIATRSAQHVTCLHHGERLRG